MTRSLAADGTQGQHSCALPDGQDFVDASSPSQPSPRMGKAKPDPRENPRLGGPARAAESESRRARETSACAAGGVDQHVGCSVTSPARYQSFRERAQPTVELSRSIRLAQPRPLPCNGHGAHQADKSRPVLVQACCLGCRSPWRTWRTVFASSTITLPRSRVKRQLR